MSVRAGQIWKFASASGMQGDCQIVEVDGYGQITGRFYDSIGTECTGRVKEDDFDYMIDEGGRLSGDPEIEDDPLYEA